MSLYLTTNHYLYLGNQYLGELQEVAEERVKQAHFSGVNVRAGSMWERGGLKYPEEEFLRVLGGKIWS